MKAKTATFQVQIASVVCESSVRSNSFQSHSRVCIRMNISQNDEICYSQMKGRRFKCLQVKTILLSFWPNSGLLAAHLTT